MQNKTKAKSECFGLPAAVLIIVLMTLGGCSAAGALKPSPHDLALRLIGAAEALNATAVHYKLLKDGVLDAFIVRHTFVYPDGSTKTVTLVTLQQFEEFVTEMEQLRRASYEAIKERGFKQLAPRYAATVSKDCGDRWFTQGEVVVEQKELVVQFSQAGKKVALGVVVESTVTLRVFGRSSLIGELHPSYIGLREIGLVGSTCTITLNPR